MQAISNVNKWLEPLEYTRLYILTVVIYGCLEREDD